MKMQMTIVLLQISLSLSIAHMKKKIKETRSKICPYIQLSSFISNWFFYMVFVSIVTRVLKRNFIIYFVFSLTVFTKFRRSSNLVRGTTCWDFLCSLCSHRYVQWHLGLWYTDWTLDSGLFWRTGSLSDPCQNNFQFGEMPSRRNRLMP